jgi:hypothetical protein
MTRANSKASTIKNLEDDEQKFPKSIRTGFQLKSTPEVEECAEFTALQESITTAVEECNQKLKAVVIRCMQLELQAIQTKAVTLMCEMFEHICHIMAKVQGQNVSLAHQIALSIVSNYPGLLLKHIKLSKNDFVNAYCRTHNLTACPTLFEFDVHAGTSNYSGNLLEIKRHLENLFVEPWSRYLARIEKNALDLYIEKTSKEFLTTKATIDADMVMAADPCCPLYHA